MKRIAFYMPKHSPSVDVFGAATLGFAGKPNFPQDASVAFGSLPTGTVLNGTYEDILKNIPAMNYKAAIVLCGNAGGENAFVKELYNRLGCPIVGGGAAMDGSVGGLIAGGGEASVMLIDDEGFDIRVETKNIHEHVIGRVKVGFDKSNPRVVTTLDGAEPREWLNEKKRELGFSDGDFEHLTLSDQNGVNAHLSFNGENIVSGRDLECEMILRYVLPSEVYASVFDFYNDSSDAIVFGCAGIKGITGEVSEVASLGLYMYGEICMTDAGCEFGNLMLSKIIFTKKQ